MRPAVVAATVIGALGMAAAAGLGSLAAHDRTSRPTPPSCQTRTFEGARFTVCPYSTAKHELRLAVTGRDRQPLRGFARLSQALGSDASRIRFAMNAGMYDANLRPVGLYVENGRVRRRIATGRGEGNFFLKPNGVFSVNRDGSVRVETTEQYAARRAAPLFATQSGPMLVTGGKLHPAFQPNGASRLIRNGVGVRDRRNAVFVISDTPVSFGVFARFFRDELRCPNALYLDGTVSALWAPQLGRRDASSHLGPLLVVLNRKAR